MGDMVSTVIHHYPDGFAQDITSTGQRDWITKHAELSELSIVETERLWDRFQQLGCDDSGIITTNYISSDLRYKEDVLLRNLLLALAGADKVYFHTFLNIMRWTNEATVEQKCKAIFSFFNNGNSLGRELFGRILRRIYPEKDEPTLAKYQNIVFTALSAGSGSSDELGYDNFMRICNILTEDQLNEVLDFSIIPHDINAEAQQRFEPQWRSNLDGMKRDLTDRALVCQQSYDELSKELGAMDDWQIVIKELNFTESEINSISAKYGDGPSKVNTLLLKWKEQQDKNATVGLLRTAVTRHKPQLGGSVYGLKKNEER